MNYIRHEDTYYDTKVSVWKSLLAGPPEPGSITPKCALPMLGLIERTPGADHGTALWKHKSAI
ncbi:MAG: hypothetical protein OXH01_10565 [Bacteroidetes bacterium]|nr:hypothetical protein [Bacteroidota bacterium]